MNTTYDIIKKKSGRKGVFTPGQKSFTDSSVISAFSCLTKMVDDIERGYPFGNVIDATAVAALGATLKKGLGITYRDVADNEVADRLVVSFKELTSNGNVAKISENKELLVGFNLNAKRKFEEVFPSLIPVSCNDERTKVIMNIPAFHSDKTIKLPDGCTHFRFVNQAVAVSDYNFNSLLNTFEPENALFNGASALTPSDLISLEEEIIGPFKIETNLCNVSKLPENVSLISFIGLHFYQDVGYGCYKFAGESSFTIRQVF